MPLISGTCGSQAVASKLPFDPLASKLSFEPLVSITSLTQLTQESAVFVVNARSSIKTLRGPIACAKAQPGKLT